MCSYQNKSGAIYGNLNFENWEDVWTNVVPQISNASNKSSCTSTYHTTPVIQSTSKQNVTGTTKAPDYQMQISTSYLNVGSSLQLSPSWEESQDSMTMSNYFSSFNPSLQFPENPANQSPVSSTSPLKAQKSAEKAEPRGPINFVSSANSTLKSIVKRKRKRTTFTTDQLEILEAVFSKKPYVTRDERKLLVDQLQLNDKSIKVWFQNRRLKNKRCEDQDEGVHVDKNAILERLDSVEFQIIEKTDEFGYVALDDKIMTELVSVIDDYFTNNISPVEIKSEIDYSPIYEPISPVSTSDYSCEENASCWQPYEPNEIVQELIDIETIITK